jgi:hypothetical protein
MCLGLIRFMWRFCDENVHWPIPNTSKTAFHIMYTMPKYNIFIQQTFSFSPDWRERVLFAGLCMAFETLKALFVADKYLISVYITIHIV